jgi:hypothetical protein
MVIGDEIKAIVIGLELKMLPYGTKKVAYMKPTGRLYA